MSLEPQPPFCVSTYARFRPFIGNESATRSGVSFHNSNKRVMVKTDAEQPRVYDFSHVFSLMYFDYDVAKTIAPSVTGALMSGYNATVVCDGDALTGKTKTLFGDSLDGVFPHLMTFMFEAMKKADPNVVFTVKMSIYEVREDGDVIDLLANNTDNTSLEVELTHEDTNNVEVRELTTEVVSNLDDGTIFLKSALSKRHQLSTVFADLTYTQKKTDDPTETTITGRLCAVDLQSHLDWSKAGSSGSYVVKEIAQAITTGNEEYHFFETSLKSLLFSRIFNNCLSSMIMHCSPALESANVSTIPSLDFLKSVEVISVGALINTSQNSEATPTMDSIDESEFQSAYSLAREQALEDGLASPRGTDYQTNVEIETLKEKMTMLQSKKMDAERFSERLQQDLQNKTNELEKLQSEKSYLAFELRSLHHKVKDFARQNERLKKVSVMASLASTKDSLFSTYWNQLEVKVTSFEKSLTQEKNALLLQLAEEQKLSQAVLKASQEKYTLSQEELRKTRSQMRTMELDHNEKERTLKREHDAELKLQKDRIEGEYEAISVEKDVLQERVAKLENELGNGTSIPRVEGSENLEANKLQEKIDSLQKEQIEKMSTISRQKVEIQNLTTQVGQLKTTISEMTSKMSELEKELLQLKDNQDVQQENKQEWEQKKNEELESLRVELNLVREKEISKLRLELEEAHANQIARVRSEIAIKKDREARESEDKILTSWEVEREHWEKQVTEMRKQIRDKEESDRQFQTKIYQLETNLAEANEKWIKSETDRAVDQKAYEKMLSAARHHVAASSGKTSTKKLIKKKTTPTAEARLSSMPRVVPHAQNAPVQITRPPQEKMKRLASVRNVLHRLNPNADKEEKPQVHTPEPTLDLQKPTSDKNENVRRALAKEGYLTKEGDKFKTWHRRFFRIAQEDNSYYLQYYETIDARKPIKQIDLGGAFVSLAPEKENGTNRLFCFKLRAVGRLLYLNASSRADREEWTKYLSVIIEEATVTSPNSKQGTPLE